MFSRLAEYVRGRPPLAWICGLTLAAAAAGLYAVAPFPFAKHGRPIPVWLPNAVAQACLALSAVGLLRFTAGLIQRRGFSPSLQEMASQTEAARAEAVEFARQSRMAEEVAGLGYWRYDMSTGRRDWSPQLYALFGLDRSEQPRQGVLIDLVHPEDREAARATIDRCRTTGEPQYDEKRILRADGCTRILRSWIKAEMDADGQVKAVLCMMMDVTEQRQAETELRLARDQAEQAAVVKAEFLANMSHELRTPLTAILGYTALAEAQPGLAPEARSCVERISAGSKALLTLVNDILDFSKLEAGEIRIVADPTDLVGLARDTLDLFAEEARTRGIALRLDVAEGMPAALLLDGGRIRQVLINLIGNAMKFTDEGSVAVELRYDAAAERLVAGVADTGPGISPDRRSLLFRRFSQIDGSATRAHGGAGLGLAICKGLIEAMDGDIGVDSVAGVGSRFWFELPAQIAQAGPTDADAGDGPSAIGGKTSGARVLVVDDNRCNRDLVKAVLGSMGAQVVEAEDGVAGIKAAATGPFDAILMDLRMPGLSGEDATSEIRRGHGPNAGTPIIAFSASADPHQLADLRLRGFDGALPKPFTLVDLVTVVDAALAQPTPADHGEVSPERHRA